MYEKANRCFVTQRWAPTYSHLLQFRKAKDIAESDEDIPIRSEFFFAPDFCSYEIGVNQYRDISDPSVRYSLKEVSYCYAHPDALARLSDRVRLPKGLNVFQLVKLEL